MDPYAGYKTAYDLQVSDSVETSFADLRLVFLNVVYHSWHSYVLTMLCLPSEILQTLDRQFKIITTDNDFLQNVVTCHKMQYSGKL